MTSPFTGGEVELLYEKKKIEFRKDFFDITQLYYKCVESSEEFSTDELDQVNLNQLYNQYRVKYGLPFPEEIKEIRTQYKLSAAKISEILGLGINSYRQYESGDIPTVANGRLILAAKDPEEFMKFLDASRSILTQKDYEKYKSTCRSLIDNKSRNFWDLMFSQKVFKNSKPSALNGFKVPREEKVARIIGYFSHHIKDLFKTKLNKLLFYSDFLHYRNTGYSISGIAYRAIQMGPVPAEYDKLYIKLVDDDLVKLEFVKFNKGYGEALSGNIPFCDNFTDSEISAMNLVIKKFGSKTTNEMVKISHAEEAWLDNENSKGMIDYSKYAFQISQI